MHVHKCTFVSTATTLDVQEYTQHDCHMSRVIMSLTNCVVSISKTILICKLKVHRLELRE